jgi:hypothetical protein
VQGAALVPQIACQQKNEKNQWPASADPEISTAPAGLIPAMRDGRYLLRRRAFALFLLTIEPALLRQSVSCCPATRSSCARRMIGLGPPDWLSADSSRSFGWRGLGCASSVVSFARVAVDLFPGRGGQRKRSPRMGIVFSWLDRSTVFNETSTQRAAGLPVIARQKCLRYGAGHDACDQAGAWKALEPRNSITLERKQL